MTITVIDDHLKSDLGEVVKFAQFERGHKELPGEFAKMRQYGLNETQRVAINNLIAGCEYDNINHYIIETFNMDEKKGFYCAVVVDNN